MVTCDAYNDAFHASAEESRARRAQEAESAEAMRAVTEYSAAGRLRRVTFDTYMRYLVALHGSSTHTLCKLRFPNPIRIDPRRPMVEITFGFGDPPRFRFRFTVWGRWVADVPLADALGPCRPTQLHRFELQGNDGAAKEAVVRRLALAHPAGMDWAELGRSGALEVERLDVALAALRRSLSARVLPPFSLVSAYERTRAAQAIQRAWREAVSNPRFLVCRKRLEREFEDFPPQSRQIRLSTYVGG